MKPLLIGFAAILFTSFVSVVPSHAQSAWSDLITGDSTVGYSVEGATKIDVATAKTLHERGVKFLDVRPASSWIKQRIPGAINLRLAQLQEFVGTDEEAVFYCSGADCKSSVNASAYALTLGYENVYYFAEGCIGWKSAGLPLDHGG